MALGKSAGGITEAPQLTGQCIALARSLGRELFVVVVRRGSCWNRLLPFRGGGSEEGVGMVVGIVGVVHALGKELWVRL